MSAPIIMRKPEPIVPRILVVLFSASLVYFVLYIALISLLQSPSTYAHITDITQQQENAAILDYLRGPLFAQNNLAFLTESERSHMTDVKEAFNTAFIISLLAVGIMLGITGVFLLQKMWERFDELIGRSLRASGWTILALAFFLVIASLLDFERLWLLFHAIFFPQGNWMFASTSTLITLYPSEFFERFVLHWLLAISSFGIVAIGLSHLLERMRKHDAYFTERMGQKTNQKTHKSAQHRK